MSVMSEPGVIVANAIIAARKISQYSGPTPSAKNASSLHNGDTGDRREAIEQSLEGLA
jgi:hypothetical protein